LNQQPLEARGSVRPLESITRSWIFNIGISDLASAQERMTSAFASELETSREKAASDSAAQREHEREEREKLDNI